MANTTTFTSMVKRFCTLRNDPDHRTYLPVATAAQVALNQMQMFAFPSVKSTPLTIQDNFSIILPDDYAGFIKIGSLCEDGTIKVFGYEPGLQPPEVTHRESACSCTTETAVASQSCEACTFHNLYYGNRLYGEYYGWRPKQFTNGKYRLDIENNRINLNGGNDIVVGDEVVLEYKPKLSNASLKVIPEDAFLMIYHKTNEILASGKTPTLATHHGAQFLKEYKAFKKLYSPTTGKDIVAAFRGETTGSPRR
jgi:hypothetical protein